MMLVSSITSVSAFDSLKELFNAMLTWYVPLFACVLIVRSKEDVRLLLKIIAIAAIIVSVAGVAEFLVEHRYYFSLFPKSMLDQMLYRNPALALIYNQVQFRNGFYRASSIYFVPLSFGEFGAIVAPIGAYFVLHGKCWREWVLGMLAGICSLLAVFCSGARGGYIGILVAIPTMLTLWTIRQSKFNPSSLVSSIMGVVFVTGTVCVLGLIATSHTLSGIVFGYDDGDRYLQWTMALPHIISNPVTGHGIASSGRLIGYHIESGLPSVDSYILTLLVEMGAPGLLLFFGMITIAIWTAGRLYLSAAGDLTALGGALACSLVAFAVYRLALSQTENHTLLFLLIALVFVIRRVAHERPDAAQEPRRLAPIRTSATAVCSGGIN
jgi:hypothetical protein